MLSPGWSVVFNDSRPTVPVGQCRAGSELKEQKGLGACLPAPAGANFRHRCQNKRVIDYSCPAKKRYIEEKRAVDHRHLPRASASD